MERTKKKVIAGVGLLTGVMIFAGSVFASYGTSNGYETGKNALKKLFSNENYTMSTEFKMMLDGEEMSKTAVTELYDRDGDVKLNRIEESTSEYDVSTGGKYSTYIQDGKYISSYHYGDGENEDSTAIYNVENPYGRSGCLDAFSSMSDEDKKTMEKVIRFVELIGDTMVGDLKNNLVYISGDDDSATYEISLDAVQIPEVINAGLAVIFSSMNSNETDDPYTVLGSDPVVKSAYLKFTVDKDGRLTDAVANVTMSGDGHEGAIDISGTITDYGTTAPRRVDISTLPNVGNYDVAVDGASTQSYKTEASETEDADVPTEIIRIDEDGSAFNSDGEKVGEIEIGEKGEGTVHYYN